MIKKVMGKWKAMTQRVYNMHTYAPERHYQSLYYPHLTKHLKPGARILDIGCQYGRFSLPLAHEGYTVTATDINKSYLRYIQKWQPRGNPIELLLEPLHTSLQARPPETYDAVLCLELLYNLPNPGQNIKALAKLVKPGGYLMCSHRGPGYYIYRFLKENNPRALKLIREHRHPDFNYQTAEELQNIYREAGLDLLETIPIGMFSGYGPDPFRCISQPGKRGKKLLQNLENLEKDPGLQRLFGQNARYQLTITRK